MRVLTDDIVHFVHSRFSTRDITNVYAIILDAMIDSPRVARAVLYLSGGSITVLRHYAERAMADPQQVLTWAEYILDVGPEPMRVRDMSHPFPHARNLGTA